MNSSRQHRLFWILLTLAGVCSNAAIVRSYHERSQEESARVEFLERPVMPHKDDAIVRPVAEGSRLQSQSKGKVLYVIKTWSGAYKTKLLALMQTWGALVDESKLFIMGDEGNPTIDKDLADLHLKVQKVPDNVCGPGPTKGLTCRVAHGLALAAQHPGKWSWVFVVDDDHYVNIAELEKSLSEEDATKKVAVGSWGCGVLSKDRMCYGKGGFCGGCGYGFSRPALQAMIGGSTQEFLAFHRGLTNNASLTEGREDMAASCAAYMRVPDLKIAKPKSDMMETSWVGGKNLTHEAAKTTCIGWHHVSPVQMHEIHQGALHADPLKASTIQVEDATRQWRMQQYIEQFNAFQTK